jgi:hypothetical protein
MPDCSQLLLPRAANPDLASLLPAEPPIKSDQLHYQPEAPAIVLSENVLIHLIEVDAVVLSPEQAGQDRKSEASAPAFFHLVFFVKGAIRK